MKTSSSSCRCSSNTSSSICLVQRDAIAASYIGIVLMEHHYYNEAIEVMTDAFRVLKSYLTLSSSSSSSVDKLPFQYDDLLIESTRQYNKASQTLARLQQQSSSYVYPHQQLDIQVIDIGNSIGYCALLPEEIFQRHDFVCLLKFDVSNVSNFSIHELCAVTVHNLAQAHLCVAKRTMTSYQPNRTSSSSSTAAIKYIRNCMQKATRLLHLSYAMQTKIGLERRGGIDVLQEPEYYTIMYIIMSNMIYAFNFSGSNEQAQGYYTKYQSIQQIVHDSEQVTNRYFSNDFAAAGAA